MRNEKFKNVRKITYSINLNSSENVQFFVNVYYWMFDILLFYSKFTFKASYLYMFYATELDTEIAIIF